MPWHLYQEDQHYLPKQHYLVSFTVWQMCTLLHRWHSEVLTAVAIKTDVFWEVRSSRLAAFYQHFIFPVDWVPQGSKLEPLLFIIYINNFPLRINAVSEPILYALFWVITWRLNFICQRFGTLCLFHLHRHVVGTKLGTCLGYYTGKGLAQKWPEPLGRRVTG